MSGATFTRIEQLDLVFAPKSWAFAEKNRAAIDAHFVARKRQQPQLWNGRVLLLHNYQIDKAVLRGAFLETDFASYLAWRERDYPPADVWDCFGSAAVLSADDAFLLGVMGPQTANAGLIYFPCGTPDPDDIKGGKIDLDFSVARELREETGLDIAEFEVKPGWTLVQTGPHVVLIKTVRTREDAKALQARVSGFLARQKNPELSAIHLVRSPADLQPAIADHARAFLEYYWR